MREGYSCCNLHCEGDWISDSDVGSLPFIAADTPIEMKSYGRFWMHVDIDSKAMRIGQNSRREQESLEKFAGKLIVVDVKAKVAGYLETDQTASLDAPVWKYWDHQLCSVSSDLGQKWPHQTNHHRPCHPCVHRVGRV